MNPWRTALWAAVWLAYSVSAHAQETFADWLGAAAERQAQAFEAIDFYLTVSMAPGVQFERLDDSTGPCTFKICQAFQVNTVDNNGTPMAIITPLSPQQLGILAGNTSSAFVKAMGQGLLTAQFELNKVIGGPQGRSELAEGGWIDPLQPLLDPRYMFGTAGVMMLEAAADVRQEEADLRNIPAAAQAEASRATDIARGLTLDGTENVAGTQANVFRNAAPLGIPFEEADGQQFELKNMAIWVDPDTDAILMHRFEGVATADGETRDFFLETVYSDFRNPPGCGRMYEPSRRVMRMGGIMNDEQAAELEEARAQLAEFERQLAAMPAQQRAMMERMMGSQMEMMRGLVNSGAIEFAEQTEEIICNPDFASLFGSGGSALGVDADLIRQIQEYLVILGYEPGNVDGVLDDLTVVAISQFQAENGLPVTGEPSLQLGTQLAERVAAQAQ